SIRISWDVSNMDWLWWAEAGMPKSAAARRTEAVEVRRCMRGPRSVDDEIIERSLTRGHMVLRWECRRAGSAVPSVERSLRSERCVKRRTRLIAAVAVLSTLASVAFAQRGFRRGFAVAPDQ